MATKSLLLWCFLSLYMCSFAQTSGAPWRSEKKSGFTLQYQSADQNNKRSYTRLLQRGIKTVNTFWGVPFDRHFEVCIHPNRQSLDSTWQKDWQMPSFHSECWMVASGIASKLDMISPKNWEREACEHRYAETTKTQQLITHELFHVFHGQQNPSPDFSQMEGLDWFVEGLATYASGQCDSARLTEVKQAVLEGKTPANLEEFWSGKLKYGLSGSVVMYLDQKYGRLRLRELMACRTKTALLAALQTSEVQLLEDWKRYVTALPGI